MKVQSKRQMIIKDYSKLESYGFVKEGSSYLFYTGNKGKYGTPIWTIYIDSRKNGHIPYICSHSNVTLEVICKMYNDGVLVFENTNNVENRIAKLELQIKSLQDKLNDLKKEESL